MLHASCDVHEAEDAGTLHSMPGTLAHFTSHLPSSKTSDAHPCMQALRCLAQPTCIAVSAAEVCVFLLSRASEREWVALLSGQIPASITDQIPAGRADLHPLVH